ncbi:SnoaL-like domain-containing protein [Planctomonas sp. JC2975]|uniref:ester cyclase n=1 Tax=Planctomonas sp. JC2975 TaxID=2729626 RepID=UPI0014750F1B|nr:ester cyclase [Planctomonas sp. JC2975]NNC13660.1 SnoaL-like domain-containing protein [Planctomonas sp. JC2975]
MDVIEIQQRVHEAWTQQRWDDWARTCANGYQFRLYPTTRLDLEQTLTWSRAWFTAFPDYRDEVAAVYVSNSAVAYELLNAGTSRADLLLFGNTVAPHTPGRRIRLRYVKVLDLNADGQVVQDRQYLDPNTLVAQLAP